MEFSSDNIRTELKTRTLFDNRAMGTHRTNYSYVVEIATLVETGGNYDGRTIESYDNAFKNCHGRRNNYLIENEIDSLLDYTGELSIEDDDDYYLVLNELKINHFGYGTFRLSSEIL